MFSEPPWEEAPAESSIHGFSDTPEKGGRCDDRVLTFGQPHRAGPFGDAVTAVPSRPLWTVMAYRSPSGRQRPRSALRIARGAAASDGGWRHRPAVVVRAVASRPPSPRAGVGTEQGPLLKPVLVFEGANLRCGTGCIVGRFPAGLATTSPQAPSTLLSTADNVQSAP